MPKKIGNPITDVVDHKDGIEWTGQKIGTYKGNTIYDRGPKSGFAYRYYMRGAIHAGFDRGPITGCGNTLKELKEDFDRDHPPVSNEPF